MRRFLGLITILFLSKKRSLLCFTPPRFEMVLVRKNPDAMAVDAPVLQHNRHTRD